VQYNPIFASVMTLASGRLLVSKSTNMVVIAQKLVFPRHQRPYKSVHVV
jgi:hypothetical protein